MADACDVHPNPIFEGSEKRFELHFRCGPRAPHGGLRSLSRDALDELMALASCEIVSRTSNEVLDSYVLSESSLFVYPAFLVIKTCGTTQVLNCLGRLLELVADIDITPTRCKYSRASFLYPDLQPDLYRSFDTEIAHIRQHLGHISNGGSAFVLGDKLHGLQWHVYVLGGPATTEQSRFHVEVCMTDLSDAARQQFFRTENFISSSHTTDVTGIRQLAPSTTVDDYVFEPCGYSMNGIDDKGYITIHVTPEQSFSYASCEMFGFPENAFNPLQKAAAIANIFEPGRLVLTFTVDSPEQNCQWGSSLQLPGYGCASATCQMLANGSCVWFYSLVKDDFVACMRTKTPRPSVMPRWPSFATLDCQETSSDGGSTGGNIASYNLDALALSTLEPAVKRGRLYSPKASISLPSLTRRTGLSSYYGMGDTCGVLSAFAASPITSSDEASILRFSAQMIRQYDLEDTFVVVDLSAVMSLVMTWRRALPRVIPLCSAISSVNPAILAMLTVLGAGFAVAGESDFKALTESMLDSMVNRVILTSAKHPRHLRDAKARGISLVVCGSEPELAKVARWHPGAQVLLHVRESDVEGTANIITAATALGISVAGISVDCTIAKPSACLSAMANARAAYDQALSQGHQPTTLQLGTGFALDGRLYEGSDHLSTYAPNAVNAALETHFPIDECQNICVVADPGHLFSEPATHMISMVHGVHESQAGQMVYEVTDCPHAIKQDAWAGQASTPLPLNFHSTDPGAYDLAKGTSSVLLAPSADGVAQHVTLPLLDEGDWLLFPRRGRSVTTADHPCVFYVGRPEDIKAGTN